MTVLPYAVATCALLLPVAATATTVEALLPRVEAAARFDRPLRADVRIACEPACRAARAILLGRGDAVYVEVENGMRALVRPDGAWVATDGRPAPAAPDQSLGDTVVLLADLAVFDRRRLRTPQISDEGPTEIVLTAEPVPPSAYALVVHTVDPATARIVKTLYFQGSVGNLTKLRRDTGFSTVAGSERPTEIRVEALRQGVTTRLALRWREAPDAPAALFEPAGLERPSGLRPAD